MPATGPVMPMTHSQPTEFEPPRADVIEHAQAAYSDLDTQLTAFFEEFRRIDLIYGAYGRRCGLSFSAYLIFDYICENDGTAARDLRVYIAATPDGQQRHQCACLPRPAPFGGQQA